MSKFKFYVYHSIATSILAIALIWYLAKTQKHANSLIFMAICIVVIYAYYGTKLHFKIQREIGRKRHFSPYGRYN